MNIIVCIKQVPDTAEVKIDPKTNTLIREGVASILNPFDAWAIEEGVQIKERLGGTVTVLTMGPPQAEKVLHEAIATGADSGILLSDPCFAGADTLSTSYTLSCAIQKMGHFHLILCGKQAIDGDTAQVGPGIAAHLNIPQIIFVKKIRHISEKRVLAERLIENEIEWVSSDLPVLISVVKDINCPRFPTLSGQMRARESRIKRWDLNDLDVNPELLGLKGSPTYVDKIFSPPDRTDGQIFSGLPHQVVEAFFDQAAEDVFP